MALGDAKSGPDVDPTLHPDSRLAFRRPRRQTHGEHRTQGIIFADDHFIRELVTTEKVNLEYCSTSDMIADIVTKALPRVTHDKPSTAMGLHNAREDGHGTLREGAC